MPKLNSNVILISSKDPSPIFDFSIQFPSSDQNIEVIGDIRLDDEFRSLISEFDISLNLPPGQHASTDLRKDWRSLWIGNSSWRSPNASVEGILDSVYTEGDREILRMNSQLSVSTHEQNACRITTEEKSLEHKHERDLNGQLRKLDTKSEGIVMAVSYGDDNKVQGYVSGDPPLLINENNFSEWPYSATQ